MLKRLISTVVIGCLFLIVNQSTTFAKETEVTIKINGAVQSFDVAPVIKNGRVLVPFRKIFEAMGAKVAWDPKDKMVTAEKFDTDVVFRIGDPTAYVIHATSGKSIETPVKLDVPAEIRDGRTLVPLRFVSESFDAHVEWVAKDRIVLITTAEPAAFITDKGLEQAIRNTLGKPNGFLSKEDMKSLEQLTIMSSSVNLKGLEYAINLKHLFLNVTQATHLEALNSLTSLQELSLDNIQSKDLSFLDGLSHLQNLRISGMPVHDITSLGTLSELKSLSISQAPIKEIDALSKLKQLEILDLEQNQITDLTPLIELSKLKHLTIYKNPVKDATPLQMLTSLTHLSLAHTELSDGSPLARLIHLQELGIPYSNLKDINFTTDLTQLKILQVAGNQIQSLPSLANLKQLNTLFLDENPIKDISPLSDHPALEKLYLNSTKITNISSLITMPSLKEVGLYQIAIDWSNNSGATSTRQQLEQNGVNVRL